MGLFDRGLVRKHFLFHGPRDFSVPLDKLPVNVSPLLVTPATVFRHNLLSVVDMARFPFRLASASVFAMNFSTGLARHSTRLHMQGQLADDMLPDPSIIEAVRLKLEESKNDPKWQADALSTTEQLLWSGLDNEPQIGLAARELLRQAASLTWAALEILFRDVFVSVLNMRPDLVAALRAKEEIKRLLPLKTIALEELETFGFDLSRRMGDLLAQNQRMDSIVSMKVILAALLADEGLNTLLDARDLRLLNQRRHIIVHRRGIVDADYIANTGDTLPVGSELEILPDDVRTYLTLVRDAGVRMLTAATTRLAEQVSSFFEGLVSDEPAAPD